MPIWISNKSETFLKSMPTSSAAINVRFLGIIDPKWCQILLLVSGVHVLMLPSFPERLYLVAPMPATPKPLMAGP